MVDLTTTYLGMKLKNPLVASASPLSEKVETVKKLEEAGIAAVVMYSLFEEQIIHESLELDHYLTQGSYSSSEAVTYLPEAGRYILAPEVYVETLKKLKQAVKIPVIGSLNGVSTGGWIKYAKKIQDAGADALELNIYYLPTDSSLTSAELEKAYCTLVSDVRKSVKIPIAVKLSPYLYFNPQHGQTTGGSRCEWPGPVQPVLPARSGYRRPESYPQPDPEHFERAQAPVAMDCHPIRAYPDRFRPHHGYPHHRGCDQGSHGWR